MYFQPIYRFLIFSSTSTSFGIRGIKYAIDQFERYKFKYGNEPLIAGYEDVVVGYEYRVSTIEEEFWGTLIFALINDQTSAMMLELMMPRWIEWE